MGGSKQPHVLPKLWIRFSPTDSFRGIFTSVVVPSQNVLPTPISMFLFHPFTIALLFLPSKVLVLKFPITDSRLLSMRKGLVTGQVFVLKTCFFNALNRSFYALCWIT